MARLFFIACVMFSFVVGGTLLGTTLESAAAPISEQVALGRTVWVRNSCEQCHSLYGQGGTYAPDLTHIVEQRGEKYLLEFFINPSAYHPNERVMPRLNISLVERQAIIAYLQFASEGTLASAVPVVSVVGGTIRQSLPEEQAVALSPEEQAIQDGRAVFSTRCASCHSLEANVTIVGPTFYDIGNTAWYRVIGQSAEQYIRSSIVYPDDYLVEGYENVMQKNFGEVLSVADIDNVIAYMMTLRTTRRD